MADAATAFTVTHESGGARRGVLRLPGCAVAVDTPALLGYTRRGAPYHEALDASRLLPPCGRLLGVDPLAFTADAPFHGDVAAAGGLAAFAGLGGAGAGALLLGSPRDPLVPAAGGGWGAAAAAGSAAAGRANESGLAVTTSAGSRRVTPSGYAAVLESLALGGAVALADDHAAAAGGASARRARAGGERTARWLGELRAAFAVRPALRRGTGLWAALGGGGSPAERSRCAAACAAAAAGGGGVTLAGVSVAGLYTGEAPAERAGLVAASLFGGGGGGGGGAPPHPISALLPRHLAGCCSPEEMIEAAGWGCDLFDGGHAHDATQQACALVFPVAPGEPELGGDGEPLPPPPPQQMQAHLAQAGRPRPGRRPRPGFACDGFKLALRSRAWARDARPLLPGCACSACARPHSRAYVHHLVNAHEMGAEVLLDAHNGHHMRRFAAALRDAIAAAAFPEFAAFHQRAAQGRRQRAAEDAAWEEEEEEGAGGGS